MRELSFSGNRAIDDATLRMSIATSQSSAFARWPLVKWVGLGEKEYLNETEFRRDVLRILALYGRTGFREARVDTLVRRSGTEVFVRFLIDEGEPVRVDSLALSGTEGIVDQQRVVHHLPLRVGDPFNLLLLQASFDSLHTILRNEGYPFPEVFQSFDVDLEGHAARVSWEVIPGRRAAFGEIQVAGTQEIDPSVVRRALSIKPGEPFSEEAMRRSRLDLYRLNLFNFVGVGLTDSVPPPAGDTLVPVRVRVTEASLRRIRLGAGYGTFDCFRTLGAWTVYDFLGGGRTLDMSARFSMIGVGSPADLGLHEGAYAICPGLQNEAPERLKLNYNLSATVREPFFLSRRTSAAVTLAAERYTEYRAYLQERLGGELSFTWRSPINVPFTFSYALSRARTEADPANLCRYLDVCRVDDTEVFKEPRTRATLGLSFVWDRTEFPTGATRGIRLTGELRHASGFLLADPQVRFTRGVVELASFHRFARRSVFAWRVRVGEVRTPLDTLYLSPADRFYAGGPNSVRGYGQNELGPIVRVVERVDTVAGKVDSIIRTSATGGDRLLLMSAELRVPLPGFADRLSGSIFVDAGQVIERGRSEERITDLKITPGVGVRIATPLGPMRLDLGFNPYEPQESHLYEYIAVVDEETNEEFTELRPVLLDYQPRVESFLGRLRLQFSVGQAF